MKCDICGGLAIIGMPQNRLNLCEEHYQAWVLKMVQRAIEHHHMFMPQDRILVAVSGGKDSLGLWDILMRLGYQTEGVYIHLGITHEDYSDVSQHKVEQFAAERGLAYQVVNVRQTYGQSIPELKSTGRGKHLCAVCGLVKRHIMNRIAYEGGYACIATGHQVDDEAAILLQNALHWQSGYLGRQGPVLPSTHPRLARKVKPLCRLYERESAAYALVRGIDFVEQECPYAVRATSIFYKQILNQIEARSPGTKRQFYDGLVEGKANGELVFHSDKVDEEPALNAQDYQTCPHCGQPTLGSGLCAFCRLWEPPHE